MLTRILAVVVASSLLPAVAQADEKLAGLHFGDPGASGSCWEDGRSLNRWKLAKYRADASGTIAYFKIHVPRGAVLSGCTHDEVSWVVYEGAAGDTGPGALKAYGIARNYDWTARGADAYHTFPVTRTGTDLTVTAGRYYWLGYYAYAMHESLFRSAGCAQQSIIHRNTGNAGCTQPLLKRFCSEGDCDAGQCYEQPGELGTPPDRSCFTSTIASLFDLSIWSALPGRPDVTPPSAPTGLGVIQGAGEGPPQ